MTIYYTDEDFNKYYQQYVKRDQNGHPIEDIEEFWERKQHEIEEKRSLS